MVMRKAPCQFDVFKNSDPNSAASHPYLVVLQSNGLTDLNTRIVAPLIASKKMPLFERLMPEVTIAKSKYVIDATNIGVVPAHALSKSIANLESERYRIVAAIDLVFTGI
jgi:toxin CcdB